MAILQSIDSAHERKIGPHGVSDKALNAALDRAEGALEWLRGALRRWRPAAAAAAGNP